MVPPTEPLQIRIESELKERAKAAAERSGRTLTSLVRTAIEREVDRIEAGGAPARASPRQVNRRFRKACADAVRGGGEKGYKVPAKVLAYYVGLGNQEFATGARFEGVNELLNWLEHNDDEAVWNWFQEKFPQLMADVPTRRRDQFIAGVREAFGEPQK